MRAMIVTIFAIASTMNPLNAQTTPTDGNFFYSKLSYSGGQTFMSMGVGSENQDIGFLLNTEELTLGVFTTNCTTPVAGQACNVPQPYDATMDTERVSNTSVNKLTFEKAYMFDLANAGLQGFGLEGMEARTRINMTVPQYKREYTFEGDLFEIIQVDKEYMSNVASGLIGLAPYTAIDPTQGST